MKTLITEFISLDGVVQAPGAPSEDTDGGFAHGGWMVKYFDPEVIGGTFDALAKQSDALLQGRRTYQVSAMAWPSRSGDATSPTGSTACRSMWFPTRSARPTSPGTQPPSSAARTFSRPWSICGLSRAATSMSMVAPRWCSRSLPPTWWMSWCSRSCPWSSAAARSSFQRWPSHCRSSWFPLRRQAPALRSAAMCGHGSGCCMYGAG